MAINVASKYSNKVDERFKLQSLTEPGINHDYDWSGVKTVTVWQIATAAMNDYSRTGLARYGAAAELQDTKLDMTLSKDRSFTFTIDKGNNNEQQMVKNSGKALARQIDEVVVPEVDIYRLAAMAAAAITAGGTATAAVTAVNAFTKFLAACEYMSDNKVPIKKRIAFITPAFQTFIMLDPNFVKASETGQKMMLSGEIGTVNGVRLIVCPSSYFPASTAFIMVHPSATVAADKLEDYKTHDNPPGINGWLVEGRIIYDAFVLTSKTKALFIHKIA